MSKPPPEVPSARWFAELGDGSGAASSLPPRLRDALRPLVMDDAAAADAARAAEAKRTADTLAADTRARKEKERAEAEAKAAEGRRRRRSETWQFAKHWFGWLIPLSLVTQIWAGGSTSPGQGGGVGELLAWTALFGGVCLAMVASRASRGPVIDRALVAAYIGFVVGAVAGAVWFTATDGPDVGEWFVGPGGAAVAVAIALYLVPGRRQGRGSR
jgi:hypothetical protein